MTVKKEVPVTPEPAPLSYVISVGQKPYQLELIGPANLAMNEAACHIRAGYVPCPSRPPFIYPFNGNMQVWLVLGSPDETAIAAAKETSERGLREQNKQYAEDVAREVEVRVEQIKRETAAKRVEALKAQQAKDLAALEKATAAAIAAL
jgi:hypothetical protein